MKPLVAIALLALLAGLAPQPAMAGRQTIFDWLDSLPKADPVKPKKKPARAARAADPMKAIRMRMIDGKASYDEIQRLADSGDDLGAFYLGKRIEEAGDPDRLDTAGHYYLRALYAGRTAALRPLIRLLQAGALDEQPRNLADAEKVLVRLAGTGDTVARDGLIAMYRGGAPFGARPEAADRLLVAAAEGGDGKAAFDLAVSLLRGTPDTARREQARAMLRIAATSDTLNIRTMAENMLRYLDPQITASTETVP